MNAQKVGTISLQTLLFTAAIMALASCGDSKVVERFSTASPSSSIRKDGSASSELDESSFPEGKAAYRLHRKLERDTGLAKIAKQKRLNHAGRLICDVCDFDFFET